MFSSLKERNREHARAPAAAVLAADREHTTVECYCKVRKPALNIKPTCVFTECTRGNYDLLALRVFPGTFWIQRPLGHHFTLTFVPKEIPQNPFTGAATCFYFILFSARRCTG